MRWLTRICVVMLALVGVVLCLQTPVQATAGAPGITLGLVSCKNRTLTVSVEYRNGTNKKIKLDVLYSRRGMEPRVVSGVTLAPHSQAQDTIIIKNFKPNNNPAMGGTATLIPRIWVKLQGKIQPIVAGRELPVGMITKC